MLLVEHFLLLTCWCIMDVESKPFHIAGGKVARKAQFPYFVQLEIQDIDICGGSLIHSQWVLSAGHCFNYRHLSAALRNDTVLTYMGSNVRFSKSASVNYIKEIYFHPNFYFESPDGHIVYKIRNDIAIGRLKYPYSLDYKVGTVYLSSPISNLTKWTTRCRKGTVMGIGVTELNTLSERLLYARQSPKDDLKEFPISGDTAQSTTFFTIARANQGHTLGGDSGGPFICYHGRNIAVQYGLLSMGGEHTTNIGTKYSFAIFERVDVHLDFIRRIVPYINVHDPY